MHKICVERLRCVESSDAADDIYIIAFRGNTTQPFDSNVAVHGPGNFWEDLDAGEIRKKDIDIAMFRPDAVYVVMLVEQDDGRDIEQKELGLWRTLTNLAWQGSIATQVASGLNPNQEAQMAVSAEAIIDAFWGAASATLRAPNTVDDIMGRPRRIVISPGKDVVMNFIEQGGDGHYRILFRVK